MGNDNTTATAALPFGQQTQPRLRQHGFFSFTGRIGIHPEIANAYALLSLTHILSKRLLQGFTIDFLSSDVKPYQGTEQELMESLFLELTDSSIDVEGPEWKVTHRQPFEHAFDLSYYFIRYQDLAFIKNLRARFDFQMLMVKNARPETREKLLLTLNQYLIEQLALAGLRWDMPFSHALNNEHILIMNRPLAPQLSILLSAMNSVLTSNRGLLNSKAMFWEAFDMACGLTLVASTLAAIPIILHGHAVTSILFGLMGAYLIYQSWAPCTNPSFREHLCSQPSPLNKHTIMINKDEIVVKKGSFLSYGTFWKNPPKIQEQDCQVPDTRPQGTYAGINAPRTA